MRKFSDSQLCLTFGTLLPANIGYIDIAARDVAAAPQTPQLGGAQANFGGPS